MGNELYADGIGEITVTGSIVRIDSDEPLRHRAGREEQSEAGVPSEDHHAGRRLRQRRRSDAEGAWRPGRSRRGSPGLRCELPTVGATAVRADAPQAARNPQMRRRISTDRQCSSRLQRCHEHATAHQPSVPGIGRTPSWRRSVARAAGARLCGRRTSRSPSGSCFGWQRMPGCVPGKPSFRGESLLQLGEAYPVLAELENGNWVVIAGAVVSGEQEMVRVLDPLAAAARSAASDRTAVLQELARLGRAVEAQLSPFRRRPAIRLSLVRARACSPARAFPRRRGRGVRSLRARARDADLLPARHRQGAGAPELCDAHGADHRHRESRLSSMPPSPFCGAICCSTPPTRSTYGSRPAPSDIC